MSAFRGMNGLGSDAAQRPSLTTRKRHRLAVSAALQNTAVPWCAKIWTSLP